jgi:nitroreductase
MVCLEFANRVHSLLMTKLLDNEQLLLAPLNWRYATKQFDSQRKISAADWFTLEEALQFTPSSGGLQPWKFIIVTDPTERAKLTPPSNGQAQINAASHLVVFAAKTNFSEAGLDAHLVQSSACGAASNQSPPKLKGQQRAVFVSSNDADASATAAAAASQLGSAPIELGRLDKGGVALHALDGEPGGLLSQNVEKLIGETYE